jgi:hypothetical protein
MLSEIDIFQETDQIFICLFIKVSKACDEKYNKFNTFSCNSLSVGRITITAVIKLIVKNEEYSKGIFFLQDERKILKMF